MLLLAAARSFAMNLRVLPLADDWAFRRLLLITRSEAAAGSPLGALIAYLERCAAGRLWFGRLLRLCPE